MGHYDQVVIRSDQEASSMDLLKVVAQERGASKTILVTAPRSDSKANGEAEHAVGIILPSVTFDPLGHAGPRSIHDTRVGHDSAIE